MKRLLESSIDPTPDVFVSGAGGLRPSKIGYKPQLQTAVRRASAFVGLITQASKEREWIFYEAGAAWGRGQIYAPVLIDTSPSDLPSSIADYQATRANNVEEMQRLVEILAEAVGGEAKTRFAQRYRAFEKAINAYLNREETPEPDDASPLGEAWRLMREGKGDEANAVFEKLESEATSADARAEIRFSRLIAGKETGVDLLEKFEAVEDELKATAEWRFWKGALEPMPLTAMKSLEESLRDAKPGTFVHRMATLTLARRNVEIAREPVARLILASAVRATDRTMREEAVERWLELFPSLEPPAKLLLVMFGLTARKAARFQDRGIDVALDNQWPALLARFAGAYDDDAQSAHSANQLGRAFGTLELPSLAFRAYSRAATGGVTVAKSNLAALLRSSPVAAAGHEILEAHAGEFDAATKAYPFRVRAEVEEAIEKETKRAGELRALGFKITQQLGLLADLALADNSDHTLRDDGVAAVVEQFATRAPSIASRLRWPARNSFT